MEVGGGWCPPPCDFSLGFWGPFGVPGRRDLGAKGVAAWGALGLTKGAFVPPGISADENFHWKRGSFVDACFRGLCFGVYG